MDSTEEQRVISLCTGYGGIELGLKRVSPTFRTVCYVEIEAFACANLVAKIEEGKLDAAPIWTDLKTFPAQEFSGKVHGITGGYPCQPFSCAGKRKGTDDPRHLWPHIARIVQTVRPLWCFFENVPGHLTLGFPEVYRSLRNLGYKVEAGLFSAAECGAPHRRQRLFILSKLGNTEIFSNRRISRDNLSKESEDGAGPQQLRSRSKLCNSQLANTQACRIQGNGAKGKQKSEVPIKETLPGSNCRGNSWPSRPGQPQYEWEEPRVVRGMAKSPYGNVSSWGYECGSESEEIEKGETVGVGPVDNTKGRNDKKGTTKPQLGRAANGTNCRVDRLRLLGNGVVPQCAEKAFRYLVRQINDNGV